LDSHVSRTGRRVSALFRPCPALGPTFWVADITYVHTDEGWLYLAGVMDLCTRKIVGWAMRETLHAEIVIAAWLMAVQRQRPRRGLIHHSDRGSQYACEAFCAELEKVGAVASMSRKADCLDNAAMESFWHTLKTELVYRTNYKTKRGWAPRSIRLHRRLLQSTSDPLHPRLYLTSRG
jgi:transposase InsO family protein